MWKQMKRKLRIGSAAADIWQSYYLRARGYDKFVLYFTGDGYLYSESGKI